MTKLEVIGRRLKSGLIDKGMSYEELADAIGVSKHTVQSWICGRSAMSITSAIAVSDILDWPLDRLVVRREESD